MNKAFAEIHNSLLQRYQFAIEQGNTHEVSARITLRTGLRKMIELAHSCEDIDALIDLQRRYSNLRDNGTIPRPI